MEKIHAHGATCDPREQVTCGGCGLSWCERHDGTNGPLCHQCNGRGHTLAPWGARDLHRTQRRIRETAKGR